MRGGPSVAADRQRKRQEDCSPEPHVIFYKTKHSCKFVIIYIPPHWAWADAGVSFGFVPTTDGLGDATFDVGTNGTAFGVANNSTISVTQMMVAVNANASNGVLYNNVTSLLNDCYNQLGQVNGDGGIN